MFARSYLFVDAPGPADAETVAALLDAAAFALSGHGAVTVQHIVFDTADHAGLGTSLTVYHDRIERRRRHREQC